MPETLTVDNVVAFREHLLAALTGTGPLTLDASAVANVDTLGAQLLVAFLRAAHARDIAVGWVAPSPGLFATADALGMVDLLRLPRLPT